MNNEQITNIIEQASQRGLSSFGVRFQGGKVNIGDKLDNSNQFGDTWETEELTGTSCLTVSYDGFEVLDIDSDLAELEMYKDKEGVCILVGGTGSYEGTDLNETVIENAEVLYIFGGSDV